MDFKKIRKSSTLFGIVIGILLVILFFVAMFNYVNNQANNSGMVLSDTYGNTTERLLNSQNELSNTKDKIVAGFNNVTEPKEGVFSILNGLSGLARIFKIPLDIIDTVTGTFDAVKSVITQGTGIPGWMITTVSLGLIIFVIFIIWSAMKGDQQKIV